MLVLRSRFFNLKLKMAGPTAQTNRLIGLAADMILVPLSASGVTMTCYREPPNPATETLDRSGRLEKLPNVTLPFGQSYYFEAGHDIFVVQNGMASTNLIACLSTTALLTTRWRSTTQLPAHELELWLRIIPFPVCNYSLPYWPNAKSVRLDRVGWANGTSSSLRALGGATGNILPGP